MSAVAAQAVVIGGSAGSLDALSCILPALPVGFPLPVFVVVHLPPAKDSLLADLFGRKCALPVCEAKDKQPIEGGKIYIAPPDYHLLVEQRGFLSLSYDAPQMFSRPSIDVLFDSAADVYGPGLIGVILSGANSDGAGGLKKVLDEDGVAIVQSPDEAYARAMPLAALEACPEATVLSPAQIAMFLIEEGGK